MLATATAYTPVIYTTPTFTLPTTTVGLSTIFTAPTSCYDGSIYGPPVPWAGGTMKYAWSAQGVHPECRPTGFRYSDGDTVNNPLLFSPGVCPLSWNYVATTTTSAWAGGQTTTLAVCCPPKFYGLWPAGQQCVEQFTTSLPGLIDYDPSATILVWQKPVSIAWGAWDLSKFTPASAPLLALEAQERLTTAGPTTTSDGSTTTRAHTTIRAPTTTTNSSTQTATRTPTPAPTLSIGAVAGIAVGCTLAGLALGAVIISYIVRRRSRAAAAHNKAAAAADTGGQINPSWYGGAAVPEKRSVEPYRVVEMDSQVPHAELDNSGRRMVYEVAS